MITLLLFNISNLVKVQDFNAQNILLMDECFFRGIPPSIIVVDQKVNIPSIDPDSVPPYHEDLRGNIYPVLC